MHQLLEYSPAEQQVFLVQKRPTTQPKDYITAFSKNFPDVKVPDPTQQDNNSLANNASRQMQAMSSEATTDMHMQGGTCILVGDTPSRVAQAAKFAEKHLGCKVMQSAPYYRTDGHLQVYPPVSMRSLGCGSIYLCTHLEGVGSTMSLLPTQQRLPKIVMCHAERVQRTELGQAMHEHSAAPHRH